jgi:hypothetical protein
MVLHRRMIQPGLPSHLFRLLLLFLAMSQLISNSASADPVKRPFWTEQAMFRFGEDFFFVGQASCSRTSEEGRQMAFAHGMQELLNYAQARDASGLSVDTQMVFEESGSPGCPRGTVTVWRLLRVEADRLAKLAATSHRRRTIEGDQSASIPGKLTLSVGMSRDEVFERFGLPASITMHHGNEFTWEYRRFGFAVEFDRHMFVKRWTIPGAEARKPSAQIDAHQRVAPNDAPIVDLTPRLRNLEQTGQESIHTVSTVYNRAVFAQRSMPTYVERSLTPAEAAASTFNISPRQDTLSDKISGLWTCRGEDGQPGRGAFLQTRRGVIINPACTNPWNR